ncbi:cysteine proteinase [Mollisia scopiformis]|uniref:Ubiquitin carboxyl-terminal hydrolase n=1 Tax=Mollisia scopiformis TaxID=149040 RepID=A0A132B6E4_MOLSC|nr:cysteine proteinase [Mollisia scopiformis]KUJ07978.1 cysteine proteinase [Mollisia scopiformis]
MPDKNLTIATYAAGAGLAAVAIVYVFGPTYFIDNESANTTARSRKNTIIGLNNPANDCFINSVLQALAGLGDMRIYLTQETHRRDLGGPEIYAHLVEDPARKSMPAWKIEGLQAGMVTFGLRDMLNKLNERPIYKKTISAAPFVQCLQDAFKQKISRQQQDAQEFLQVLAERLCDEYHAGYRARDFAHKTQGLISENGSVAEEPLARKLSQLATANGESLPTNPPAPEDESLEQVQDRKTAASFTKTNGDPNTQSEEDGFPFEGSSESQIECSTCGFKPKATRTTFCSLTLSVPQVSSTTLSSCFDQMFKTEYIEDFKCEKCRLLHALEMYEEEYSKSNSDKFRTKTKQYIDKIRTAIDSNPEDELKDVEMPDRKFAPKRKIAKHVRITEFPKIMAIHLSRSIFDASRSTMKNSAKVSFPERLPLGGLADRKFYKLSSVVCHKGSHHSGHYETFRRQSILTPYSNPNTFRAAAVYSKSASPMTSEISTPYIGISHRGDDTNGDVSTLSSMPEVLSPSSAASSSPSLPYTNGYRISGESSRNGSGRHLSFATSTSGSSHTTTRQLGPTSAPRDPDPSSRDPETGSIRSIARSAKSTLSSRLSRSKTSSPSPSDSTPSAAPTLNKKVEMNGASTRTSMADVVRPKRKRKTTDRWWRISDDKIKESKTSDVLGMQREVYLLFYELEKDDSESPNSA